MVALTKGTALGILRLNYEAAKTEWRQKYPTVSWNVRVGWNAKDREERERDRRYILSLEARIREIEDGPQPLKVCSRCRTEKPQDEFYADKKTGQPFPACKDCIRAGSLKWWRAHRKAGAGRT